MTRLNRETRWLREHSAPGDDSHLDREPTSQGKPSDRRPMTRPGLAVEGYWQEWTPEDPQPDHGYDAELHLPPGAYLVNASANVLLESEAVTSADVECSLFVGQTNVSPNQFVLYPGERESISATSHVDSSTPTVVQWVCGSTSGPFRLSLAVTAVKVDRLHHVG